MPVRAIITSGTEADCTRAMDFIEGMTAECLLADKGYDSNNMIKQAEEVGMKVAVPPKKNRKIQREYDKDLYKHRHLVENDFLHLKRWRGIATSYAKNTPLVFGCCTNTIHCSTVQYFMTILSSTTVVVRLCIMRGCGIGIDVILIYGVR